MASKAELHVIGNKVEHLRLADLLLDENNPRFGHQDRGSSQEQLLDHIVEKFGVDDVLSSLAVNGYFDAEPLVCRRLPKSKKAIVVEGNRRLAACLIITGDLRAANQAVRTIEFSALWEKHNRPTIDPVPAILFDGKKQERAILSYLGVRHIASAQPWDSYAKAAWVARVVEDSGLNIGDVSQMIGDQHRTVSRLLEGYYLVKQLVDSGHFLPTDSVRRGRGSVTDYPFSWVYTILGYAAVRKYLNLKDGKIESDPLAAADLPKGQLLVRSMFGDRSRGRNSAVNDSRELSVLASAFSSRQKIQLLEAGKTVEEIEALTRPLDDRLAIGLNQIRDVLRDLIAGLSESSLEPDSARELTETAGGNRRMAADLEKRLKDIAFGADENG